ncbi:MAG: electron transfer flavoprotein subunit beta/FixA family protein [Thermomicrobium sp.]|nr:electron transfer flavoprotein subunit beta/FixA family protein [Thermomicrobium sp.]MDW7982542.1 electron transfer flavoprotein subunit beta/FixA family protein [Thermomicrobium sp.]
MKIAVLVKQVPDPNAVRFDPRLGDLVPGIQQVVNEYDLYALEAALRLREQVGGEVVAASVGPAREALNRALAMGVDRAVAIEGEGLPGDSWVTALVLAAWLRREQPEVIWCGQESSDAGTGNVGPAVAALLDVPLVSNVVGWQYRDGLFEIEREIEDGHQFQAVAPPVVLCALSALPQPRLPTLRGIMDARRKPTERLSPAALGLEADDLRPLVRWEGLRQPTATTAGIVVQDVPAEEAVEQLLAFLEARGLVS